jgi:hypothetical protein
MGMGLALTAPMSTRSTVTSPFGPTETSATAAV